MTSEPTTYGLPTRIGEQLRTLAADHEARGEIDRACDLHDLRASLAVASARLAVASARLAVVRAELGETVEAITAVLVLIGEAPGETED